MLTPAHKNAANSLYTARDLLADVQSEDLDGEWHVPLLVLERYNA